MYTDKEAELKEYNTGISILKLALSFGVVLCHFYYAEGILGFLMIIAVPSFMFISFYLTYQLLGQKDSRKFLKRVERLLIPHLFWGVYYIRMSSAQNRLLFRELKWQILAGSTLNSSQWFLVNQIFITCILYGILKILGKLVKEKRVLGFILLLCIILQYSGLNYAVCSRFPEEAAAAYGRICEMFPMACLGILYAICRNKHFVWKYRFVFYGIFVLSFLLSYRFYLYVPNGFMYQGIPVMVASTALCVAFVELPGVNSLIGTFINQLSKYTLGIYCVHILIGNWVKDILDILNITFHLQIIFPVLIWIVSIIVSVLLSFIPIKLFQRAVM